MSIPAKLPCKLAPSILNADFSRLGEAVSWVEKGGADLLHLDVMDGHFVPNFTLGPVVVKALKPRTTLPLDCHLMVKDPERFVEWFADAGADSITVHAESTVHLDSLVRRIRERGLRVGVSLNPATPLETLEWVLPEIDMVLLMSVNPGFGGQKFIPYSLERARRLRATCEARGLRTDIQMDGGIGLHNLQELRQAGVNVFVVGTAIFNSPDPEATTRAFKAAMA
jgi:ribulose-phosphate 3-epimerase